MEEASPSSYVAAGREALEEETAAQLAPAAVQRQSSLHKPSFHRHDTNHATRSLTVLLLAPTAPINRHLLSLSVTRSSNVNTLCFLGATVLDIADKILDILSSYSEVKRIIIHCCTNDIHKQQTELLYRDFIHLLNILMHCHSSVYVSGPNATYNHVMGNFTTLSSLNNWLSFACHKNNIDFVEMFNFFWKRSHHFAADGLHLKKAGARCGVITSKMYDMHK